VKYQKTYDGLFDDVLESRYNKANPSQGKWVTEQHFNMQKVVLEKERVVELNLNGKSTNKNK
jgi:hypothetical protein